MNNMAKPISVTVHFSPDEIIQGDLSRFLALFNPKRFTRDRALRSLKGSVDIVMDRYDPETATAVELARVAAFCKKLRAKFPFTGFFCSLETPYYMLNSYCALASLRAHCDDSGGVRVECSESELRALIQEESHWAREFCMMASLPPSEIERHVKQLRAYLLSGLKPIR